MQTRSTSQDAFTGMNGGPRQSCKPIREYEPIAWPSKPMTTNMAMFMEHFGAQKRQPYRPARKEAEYSKFETRSTQQDSYRSPNVLHPRKPIYPDEKQWEYIPFDHTSTSRAAYVAHMVTPFVAAQKPKASLNGFS